MGWAELLPRAGVVATLPGCGELGSALGSDRHMKGYPCTGPAVSLELLPPRPLPPSWSFPPRPQGDRGPSQMLGLGGLAPSRWLRLSWDQGRFRDLGHGKAVPAQASRIQVEEHFRARAGAVSSSWEMSSRGAPCPRVSRQEAVCRWIKRDHAGDGTCPGFVWTTMHGGNGPSPHWGSSGRQPHPQLATSLCYIVAWAGGLPEQSLGPH